MAGEVDDALLDRYREELAFFRRMGGRFARKHPRIAKRLELSSAESPDPHVERLIESVAFLTARLQMDLEAELPEVTRGILGQLYPHFTQPVPSMAIARITPDDGGTLTEAELIPRHTKLFVETSYQRRTCRFRTCFPVMMWPLKVTSARFETPNVYQFLNVPRFAGVREVLRLDIEVSHDKVDLQQLNPESLRFYLNGEDVLVGGLYELLTGCLHGVVSMPNGTPPARGVIPPMGTVRAVGLEEEVLPTAAHGLPGFSLLQEYFSLPEKFLFLNVEGIRPQGAKAGMSLLFLLTESPRKRLSVRPESFALGCTPVVNLFDQVSEPVHVTGHATEYLVVPDARWERTTEIHSIRGVTPSLTLEEDIPVYEPIYGNRHPLVKNVVHWKANRRPCRDVDTPGADIWMSFVDQRLKYKVPEHETLRVHCVCTNRDLPTFVDQGERMHIEDGPHAEVRLLTRPTAPMTPPMQGDSLWRLISHVALSHSGLPDKPSALADALREQLRVYQFTTNHTLEAQLQAITNVTKETVALRADKNQWRGFVRVQRITVTIDEERFAGISPVVFGAVLRQYFGTHASINVFTQLALASKQREGIWHLWPPMIPETNSGHS